MTVSKKDNKQKGHRGETLAANYLMKHKGHHILIQNYRCPFGEIDIISKAEDTLVFTEVKYRRSISHGLPGQAVNHKKQEHIIRTAYWYLNENRFEKGNIRFDIVELVENETGKWIRHLENAFMIP